MFVLSKLWQPGLSNRAVKEMVQSHLGKTAAYLVGKWDTCFCEHGLLSAGELIVNLVF